MQVKWFPSATQRRSFPCFTNHCTWTDLGKQNLPQSQRVAGQVPLPSANCSSFHCRAPGTLQVSAERPLQSQPSPAHTGEVHEVGGMSRHFFLCKSMKGP